MDEPLKYYLDEDVRRCHAVAIELRRRGIDVLSTSEAGRASQQIPDDNQLAFAATAGRVLVTQDRRFAPNSPHNGVTVMPSIAFNDYVDFLELVAHVYGTEEIRDQVIYFS